MICFTQVLVGPTVPQDKVGLEDREDLLVPQEFLDLLERLEHKEGEVHLDLQVGGPGL